MSPLVRALVPALVLAQLAGCSFGMGSAYVGQWRPHERVDFEACLQDEAGRCIDRKQVTTHVPGRRYWGVIVALPAIGVARATHRGTSSTLTRLEPSVEYLRGRGRWAVGARASFVFEAKNERADVPEDQRSPLLVSLPLTAIGRVSLSPRVSAHAGLGYSLFSALNDERSSVASRGLVGVQLALTKTHSENFILLTLEADLMRVRLDEPYRSTGVTGNLGVFF